MKPKFTNNPCPFCRSTGATNPDAEDSMDWQDYLPCTYCYGTGYAPAPKPKSEIPATAPGQTGGNNQKDTSV